MTTLITGGLGYIGSHLAERLITAGEEVVILDNLSNSELATILKLNEVAATFGRQNPVFLRCDLLDQNSMSMHAHTISKCDTVYHFAGLKSVPGSKLNPLVYYENNVVGLMNLLRRLNNKAKFVFSSSAAVYCYNGSGYFREEELINPASPYGQTKAVCEGLLRDCAASYPGFRYAALRYFNPMGSSASLMFGDHPPGKKAENLMANLMLAAVGQKSVFQITGNDYQTDDGTAIRDYIHIDDLIDGHIAAVRAIDDSNLTVNLGTGRGYSVKEVISTFEMVSGVTINKRYAPRRPGDVERLIAVPEKAERVLNWRARKGLVEMCISAWNYIDMRYNSNGTK